LHAHHPSVVRDALAAARCTDRTIWHALPWWCRRCAWSSILTTHSERGVRRRRTISRPYPDFAAIQVKRAGGLMDMEDADPEMRMTLHHS
jgi:hypothetical protein